MAKLSSHEITEYHRLFKEMTDAVAGKGRNQRTPKRKKLLGNSALLQ